VHLTCQIPPVQQARAVAHDGGAQPCAVERSIADDQASDELWMPRSDA